MLGHFPDRTPDSFELLSPLLSDAGYDCRAASFQGNRYLRALDLTSFPIRQRPRADIALVNTYSGRSFVVEDAVFEACRSMRLPTVAFLSGGALPQFVDRHPRWARRVLRRPSAIVAPSEYLASLMGERGYQVVVIPNTLDVASYRFRAIGSVRPRLLWMRAFYRAYNPGMAIRVLKELVLGGVDASLTIAGQDMGLESSTKRLARALSVHDRVRFVGFLDEEAKRAAFADHDVLLNTNRVDNMPITLLEAGASGVPIVATEVGGIPFLWTHEESALLVPTEDAAAMAREVARLVEHPELAARVARGAQQIAHRSAPDRVIPLWSDLIESLVAT